MGVQGTPSHARTWFYNKGDWAWYKQLFNFPAWSNNSICWRCMADKGGGYPYTDFSHTALWMQNRYSEAEFWRRQREPWFNPCCMFGTPGFTLEMVTIGIIHALDLGCTQDSVGNVRWLYMNSS